MSWWSSPGRMTLHQQMRSYELLAKEFSLGQTPSLEAAFFEPSGFLTCSPLRLLAACPNPNGWPRPKNCGPSGNKKVRPCSKPRPMPRCCGSRRKKTPGLDIIGDGEQARQHFVHGFLEQVEGIDFENKVKMGIRNNRYDAMVPQVVAKLRLKGRVHAMEAQLLRAHTKKNQIHLARPDDDCGHRGRPVLWRGQRRSHPNGHGLCRVAEPRSAGAASRWHRHHPI
jgi:hypothetical protein